MRNRRNYYRILHVQFDAPPAVIKASYRTIMQKLRAHPDLGGEEWSAALVNEARSVLLDPKLRAAYDSKIGIQGSEPDSSADQMHSHSDAGGRPNRDPDHPESARNTSTRTNFSDKGPAVNPPLFNSHANCAFCHNPVSEQRSTLREYPSSYRCIRCDAPLKSVDEKWLAKLNEVRKIHRTTLEQPVWIWDKWPRNSGHAAYVVDWSIAGCCIRLDYAIEVESVILLLSPVFDAVATVCYQTENAYFGLEFVSLEVKMKPGSIFIKTA